ncbi:MAG: potassium-transporting ATPase subunit KdpA [Thermoleophilaceae bacterium]|nr:potassium-transporting ATPase subunit KdpA [Thermoleophilaceae bacterium]
MLQGWIQIAIFFAALVAIVPLLGGYMARVFTGQPVVLERVFGPVERLIYTAIRVKPDRGQDWKTYARSVIFFSIASWVALYLIMRLQGVLPGNPEGFKAPPWDLSFNTASSFVTNTNWQYYGGETTMSYSTQMVGLAVQNFVSAAVGIAVLIAVVRGIASRSGSSLGNFWQDTTRAILYVLLPIAFVAALVLVSQGVIQSFSSYTDITGVAGSVQNFAFGPVASQEAIKELGTNGGGFFNVNSAMPFENPSGLTNFIEMLLVLSIPAALTFTYGRMVGNRRQGWALFAAMSVMFIAAVAVVYNAESSPTPAMDAAGVSAQAVDGTTGGNMLDKEQRFGIANSALFNAVTTVTSCGAVNSAMQSFSGVGGAVPMASIGTSEVIFGGVGSGLYGMLLFVILAVFIGGLMVGRTPEYLGKKIEAREIKLATLGALYMPFAVLIATSLAVGTEHGTKSNYSGGPQGFSETFYAYLSQGNNNGSAFAGYTGFVQPEPGNAGSFGITFADLLGGGTMLFVRFIPILLVLAIAGSLAGKKVAPTGLGTLRTDSPTFIVLLMGIVVLIGALTFFPALLLGPIVQGITQELF